MTITRLTLSGIGATGRHGANPGEKDVPQEFVVDLVVEVEVSEDTLGATEDYRGLISAARDAVASTSFDLLESIAHAVASSLLSAPGVRRVAATVHKPAAARSSSVADVAATVTLEG